MKTLLIGLIFCMGNLQLKAQKIVITEVAEVLNNNNEEALFYYNNNWFVYRKVMLQKGFIASYKLMQVKPDSTHPSIQYILETVYKDSLQESKAEPRWQKIIKELNPTGPQLLNGKKPVDFRKSIYSSKSIILVDSKTHKKK